MKTLLFAILLLAGDYSLAVDFAMPTWFKTSFLDLSEDVSESRDNGKRLMLFFHQAGCPYCAMLIEQNFSQKPIVDYFQQHFDAIDLSIWGDREVTTLDNLISTEKQFAQSLNIQFTPTLLFLNENGQVILRLNGYYPPNKFMAALRYVAEKKETVLSFTAYLAQQNPPKSNGQLNKQAFFATPPYDLSQDAGEKPIAVFFEQKACPACDALHAEIHATSATQDLLKQFHVVQLDRWQQTPVITPDGKKMTAKSWADQLKLGYVPSLILYDEKHEIMRIEAYFKAAHLQSMLDYTHSKAYKTQPNFQRYLGDRLMRLRQENTK